MVKSVLGVKHQGFTDWAIQRMTALVMTFYTAFFIVYFSYNSTVTFAEWHYLFSHQWMKVATILFILSLLVHVRIGMWTVFTDYIKSYALRNLLNFLLILLLAACFFWALLILWSV